MLVIDLKSGMISRPNFGLSLAPVLEILVIVPCLTACFGFHSFQLQNQNLFWQSVVIFICVLETYCDPTTKVISTIDHDPMIKQ